MIIIGKRQYQELISIARDMRENLESIDTNMRLRTPGGDLTKMLESNQRFMDTLTHFLAMEEKTRMREAALEELKKKALEETAADSKY